MKRVFSVSSIALLAVTAALTGCANPADDKPVAEVSDVDQPSAPAETPAEPAPSARALTLTGDSKVTWVGSKVTGSHDGGFETIDGEVTIEGDDVSTLAVTVNIDANSIYSDNERLTGHLKSADFFEVETFPTATFTSTAVTPSPEGYNVTGTLDLHGVTKSITFPATIEANDDGISATAEFVLMRMDFGITYPGKPDDLIREEVVVKFDIKAG